MRTIKVWFKGTGVAADWEVDRLGGAYRNMYFHEGHLSFFSKGVQVVLNMDAVDYYEVHGGHNE